LAQELSTPESAVPLIPAWERGWRWWSPGDGLILFWIALLHVAALMAVVVAPIPTVPVLAAAVSVAFLGGLGTTVAYHRTLAHGALKLHPAIEQGLIFLAIMNGSGAPLTWVANHRMHHKFSDTERDISSPALGGFWWSHLRWLWQAGQIEPERYCPELLAQARYRRWTRWQPVLVAISFLGALPFGYAAWAWIGPLRLLYALHVQCTVNSIAHMAAPREDGDRSQNVAWLTVLHLGQGENWHRNHHDLPAVAPLGRSWWQVDLGWILIRALERLGLAHHVRRPKATP
jgi:stearoyl-CoA desaturase (delta-9 desaturase)